MAKTVFTHFVNRIRINTCGHAYEVEVRQGTPVEETVKMLDRVERRPCTDCCRRKIK